jgi:hypothetical protein
MKTIARSFVAGLSLAALARLGGAAQLEDATASAEFHGGT